MQQRVTQDWALTSLQEHVPQLPLCQPPPPSSTLPAPGEGSLHLLSLSAKIIPTDQMERRFIVNVIWMTNVILHVRTPPLTAVTQLPPIRHRTLLAPGRGRKKFCSPCAHVVSHVPPVAGSLTGRNCASVATRTLHPLSAAAGSPWSPASLTSDPWHQQGIFLHRTQKDLCDPKMTVSL